MNLIFEKLQNLPKLVAMLIAAALLFIVLIYYPVGMIWVHEIDDSPSFGDQIKTEPPASHAVDVAIQLINREIKVYHWTPSDPFFMPGSLLTRMPAFQRGIIASVARFTIELSDQIGRARGSSQADPDLQKATGLLNYSPQVWLWDLSVSWFPTASSTKQFKEGVDSLIRYNERLKAGHAVYERRADNLLETLNRIASDLGSASAAIDTRIDDGSTLGLGRNAELFYNTKGRLYANYLLLKALEVDFANVIQEKQLQTTWTLMLDSLKDGMELNNFLILNADPDSQFFPNHLAAQGFYLMRARTQMREVTNILLK